MTVESAGVFLACTILTGIGLILIVMAILVVNNLFAKYWKPVTFTHYLFPMMTGPSPTFIEPHIEEQPKPTMTKVPKETK